MLKKWLTSKGFNHSQFNALVVIACVLILAGAYYAGAAGGSGILTAIAGSALNIGLFLAVAFGLQFFLAGVGRNVLKDIFDEHNTAAAYYIGAIFLALALLIKG